MRCTIVLLFVDVIVGSLLSRACDLICASCRALLPPSHVGLARGRRSILPSLGRRYRAGGLVLVLMGRTTAHVVLAPFLFVQRLMDQCLRGCKLFTTVFFYFLDEF